MRRTRLEEGRNSLGGHPDSEYGDARPRLSQLRSDGKRQVGPRRVAPRGHPYDSRAELLERGIIRITRPANQRRDERKVVGLLRIFPTVIVRPRRAGLGVLGCGGLIIATGDGSTTSESTRQKQAGKDPLPTGRSIVSRKREPSWLTALSRRERGVSLHLARRRSVTSSRGM